MLDTQRFAEAVAAAGVGVLAEQELYQLALLAAAEGSLSLPEDAVAAVLSKASQREQPSSQASGAGLAA